MTLAQGRVLYEVWDDNYSQGLHWLTPHLLSYLVPSHILAEARELSCRDVREDWKVRQPCVRGRYEAAWEVVVKHWPEMPIFAARRVVERVMRLGSGWGREQVEEAVVRFGLRNWTSYWVRLGGGGDEEEVKRVVAERLRGVLRSWMRVDVGEGEARRLFEKHGLLEDEVQVSYGRSTWFT